MNFLKAVLLLVALVFCAGCIGQIVSDDTGLFSKVKSGDAISVDYTLKVDGAVVDTSVGKQPFTFTVGSGQVIPGFDSGVLGMKIGEEKTFTVLPKDGYGETGSHPLAGKTLVFTVKIVEIKNK